MRKENQMVNQLKGQKGRAFQGCQHDLPDWHEYLTQDEAGEVEDLEKKARITDARRRRLTVKLNFIRNRAIKRRSFRLSRAAYLEGAGHDRNKP